MPDTAQPLTDQLALMRSPVPNTRVVLILAHGLYHPSDGYALVPPGLLFQSFARHGQALRQSPHCSVLAAAGIFEVSTRCLPHGSSEAGAGVPGMHSLLPALDACLGPFFLPNYRLTQTVNSPPPEGGRTTTDEDIAATMQLAMMQTRRRGQARCPHVALVRQRHAGDAGIPLGQTLAALLAAMPQTEVVMLAACRTVSPASSVTGAGP